MVVFDQQPGDDQNGGKQVAAIAVKPSLRSNVRTEVSDHCFGHKEVMAIESSLNPKWSQGGCKP